MSLIKIYAVMVLILGIWGTCQLMTMSILYRMESLTLLSDVNPKPASPYNRHMNDIRQNYAKASRHCLLASIVYMIVVVVAYSSLGIISKVETVKRHSKEREDIAGHPKIN